MNGVWICIALFCIQQWSEPIRVSPSDLPDMYPSICAGCWGGTWVFWHNSDHLWSSYYKDNKWSEPILVDTAKCFFPGKGHKDIFKVAWIPWVDSSNYIRLSRYELEEGLWTTSPPDERIRGLSPNICSDTSGNIWCIWTGTGNVYLYGFYLTSYYDGNSWAPPETLRKFPFTSITLTGEITKDKYGRIWVGYNEGPIWVQYRDKDGWSGPENLGTCLNFAYPTLCADSIIYVSWLDYSPTLGKISMRYRDKNNWSEIIKFPVYTTDEMGYHNPHQDISVDDRGRLWSVWWEQTPAKFPHYFIIAGYYDKNEWKDTTIVDSSFGSYGGYPSISFGDNKLWAVWQSEKEGDYNIYVSYLELSGIEENTQELSYKSLQISPNPFMKSTVISYRSPVKSRVNLKIYDALGRLIRTLPITQLPNDLITKVVWDGTDDSGRKVPDGVYFCRIEAGSFSQSQKLLFLR